jgi:hypothetical protein
MYLVKYYILGNKIYRKYFPTLHEATMFAVYKVRGGNVHEIIKVDK